MVGGAVSNILFDEWVLGHPCSDKNRRRIVRIGRQSRLIKSAEALEYEKVFNSQCRVLDSLTEKPVAVWVDAFYRTRRPDLNCLEFVKDILQDKVYVNDKQVKAQGATWNYDKENPRVRVRVQEIVCPDPSDTEHTASLDLVSVWGEILDI